MCNISIYMIYEINDMHSVKFTCWLYMYGFCDIGGGADKPADGSNNLFGFPVKS